MGVGRGSRPTRGLDQGRKCPIWGRGLHLRRPSLVSTATCAWSSWAPEPQTLGLRAAPALLASPRPLAPQMPASARPELVTGGRLLRPHSHAEEWRLSPEKGLTDHHWQSWDSWPGFFPSYL